MEAPLHKLCGTKHWSREPCPAQRTTPTNVQTVAPKPSGSTAVRTPSGSSVGGAGTKSSLKFDRAAYQKAYIREYMRKYRARQAEAKRK